MAQIETPVLKKLAQLYAGRVAVLLYPSIYRALKLTFPGDVEGIVFGQTSDISTGSLGQCVRVLTAADLLIRVKLKNVYQVSKFECQWHEGLK